LNVTTAVIPDASTLRNPSAPPSNVGVAVGISTTDNPRTSACSKRLSQRARFGHEVGGPER
jgi:hypothetical protein